MKTYEEARQTILNNGWEISIPENEYDANEVVDQSNSIRIEGNKILFTTGECNDNFPLCSSIPRGMSSKILLNHMADFSETSNPADFIYMMSVFTYNDIMNEI